MPQLLAVRRTELDVNMDNLPIVQVVQPSSFTLLLNLAFTKVQFPDQEIDKSDFGV